MDGLTLVLVVAAAFAGGAVVARFARGGDDSRGLDVAVERMVALADQRLGAHSQVASGELAATKGLIDGQLGQVRSELDRVVTLVCELEAGRERAYGALSTQIAAASQRTAELADTTASLRQALSSTKARGQLGERMAGDVLRLAGFLEGVNYVRQRAVAGGGIPDYAFFLPGGREVRMDVKFPLDNYLRHLSADDEAETARFRKAFLADVRHRVAELGRREYRDPDATVDCVLLFIPNEQLFAFVQEHDPTLLDGALRRKVVCCSPLTLFAVLAVIRQAVESFALGRTSDEILSLLAAFASQWDRFVDQLDTVGGHLERTQNAYETLTTTRRRQLERQLQRLDDLRVARDLPVTEAQPDPRVVPDRAEPDLRSG
jgi:DNA recombination protein RmuC